MTFASKIGNLGLIISEAEEKYVSSKTETSNPSCRWNNVRRTAYVWLDNIFFCLDWGGDIFLKVTPTNKRMNKLQHLFMLDHWSNVHRKWDPLLACGGRNAIIETTCVKETTSENISECGCHPEVPKIQTGNILSYSGLWPICVSAWYMMASSNVCSWVVKLIWWITFGDISGHQCLTASSKIIPWWIWNVLHI